MSHRGDEGGNPALSFFSIEVIGNNNHQGTFGSFIAYQETNIVLPIGCLKASHHGANFHPSLDSFIGLKKHRLTQHLALFLGQALTEKIQSSGSAPTENIESPLAGSLVFNNIWSLPSLLDPAGSETWNDPSGTVNSREVV